MSTVCFPAICFSSIFVTTILYFVLKEKWKDDKKRDKKIFTVIFGIFIIAIVSIIIANFVLFAPKPYYAGMEAKLKYSNENNTTSEEIKEILIENISYIEEIDSGLKFSFSNVLNSSGIKSYSNDVKVIIFFNEKIQSANNSDIIIILNLHNVDGNPKVDKKEIINNVEFIQNLLYSKLGKPYSVEYKEDKGLNYY